MTNWVFGSPGSILLWGGFQMVGYNHYFLCIRLVLRLISDLRHLRPSRTLWKIVQVDDIPKSK